MTFDDARPVHLSFAAPALDSRDLRGMFYLLICKLSRIDDWKRLAAEGHEIGNHTISHEHPARMDGEMEEIQVEDTVHFLKNNLGIRPLTFAFPYGETSPGLDGWVKAFHFAARSGWADNFYLTPDTNPDFYHIPSQVTKTEYTTDTYRGWIDTAMQKGAWTVFQIHGIGAPDSGWEPIPAETFTATLDYLKTQQTKGLWVAPFSEVAAYFRAQTIFVIV